MEPATGVSTAISTIVDGDTDVDVDVDVDAGVDAGAGAVDAAGFSKSLRNVSFRCFHILVGTLTPPVLNVMRSSLILVIKRLPLSR